MTFLTELARLKAAATKNDGEKYADHSDDPLWTKKAAADVCAYTNFIRNHADAIEALVKAADKANKWWKLERKNFPRKELSDALAALDAAGKGE